MVPTMKGNPSVAIHITLCRRREGAVKDVTLKVQRIITNHGGRN
jgi:hypothetical protein